VKAYVDGDPDPVDSTDFSEPIEFSLPIICCDCPFQCDFDEDSFLTALDLGDLIDILFAGDPDIIDPSCTTPRGDFDCNSFTTSLDLAGLIDHLFVGGPGPCDPCSFIP
jgi:hypothetical protein